MGSGEGCGEGCATVGGKRAEEMVRRIDANEPQANEEAGKERAEEMVGRKPMQMNHKQMKKKTAKERTNQMVGRRIDANEP